MKKLNFSTATQVSQLLKSPVKERCIAATTDVRRSPRKLGLQSPGKPGAAAVLLQSPRKRDLMLSENDVRRSPRKHNTPLRLARQEGRRFFFQKLKKKN